MTTSTTPAAARRVTPTAVRLLPADADREGWSSFVPLTQGMFALVDAVDYPAVTKYSWCVLRDAYTTYARRGARRQGRSYTEQLHTYLTGWAQVDHVNGNGLDNRRANLREATRAENNANRRGWSGSGFKGVTRDRSQWRARIRIAGTLHQLGGFATPEQAARAYDAAARTAFGAFARLNFPEER